MYARLIGIETIRGKDKKPYGNHKSSAIWYALDDYTVADIKERKSNSIKGK